MRFNHIDAKMRPVNPFNHLGTGKMPQRYYYAVEFRSGPTTTTGEPNPRTGRYSQAVFFKAFKTEEARDAWVDKGRITSDMQGNCRQAATRARLRWLRRGDTLAAFNEDLERAWHDAEHGEN